MTIAPLPKPESEPEERPVTSQAWDEAALRHFLLGADTETLRRISLKMLSNDQDTAALKRGVDAALRPRTALEMFASDLPDEVFEGVFDPPDLPGWRGKPG